LILTAGLLLFLSALNGARAQESGKKGSSFAPVDIKEDFTAIMARMKATKPEVMKRQMELLKSATT
jgi:hypothetical protein